MRIMEAELSSATQSALVHLGKVDYYFDSNDGASLITNVDATILQQLQQ